jgi:hypothetical protein
MQILIGIIGFSKVLFRYFRKIFTSNAPAYIRLTGSFCTTIILR